MASKLSMFLAELKRRKVTRVAVVYALVGLGVIEGAQMILPTLQLEAGYPYIVVFVLFGFPLALVFAWAYEITPEGLKKEKDLGHTPSGTSVANNALYFTIIGLLVVSLIVVTLWPTARRDSPSSQSERDRPNSDGPSIAVLSLMNDSGDPDQDYFSSGLTDDLVTGLTKYTELTVIDRTLTLASDDRPLDVGDLGAALDVGYILQGSVRKAGDRIRVTVQLSDAFDGRIVWREDYDRDLTVNDVFSLQDDLTQQVVNAVAGSYGALTRAELAEGRREPPNHLDSYDCVLRAYEYLHIHDPPHHLKARQCLEAVVEHDSAYADGWAWLGYMYAEEYHHRRNEDPESYDSRERALEAAERAVTLDPANQVAQGALALASTIQEDHGRGRIAAYRAIELNPNNALWLGLLGTWLSFSGDFERGVPMVRKALVLDANPPPWIHMAIFLEHFHQGRYEAALAEAQLVETGDFRTPAFLAAVYGQLGHGLEADQALSELRILFQGSLDDLSRELTQRNGFAPEVALHIVEGLRKAGSDTGSY